MHEKRCFGDTPLYMDYHDKEWGRPLHDENKLWEKFEDMPLTTPLSDRISKDLKKLGFKFVGSTIIYSFMQATGMVNDHFKWCCVYEETLLTRARTIDTNHAEGR